MSVSYLIGGRDFSPCPTIAAPKTEGFTCQFHVSAQQHTVCVWINDKRSAFTEIDFSLWPFYDFSNVN